MAVNLVANLFAFVAKYRVGPLGQGYKHQIVEKTVQFHSGVRRAGQAAAAKHAGLQTKVFAVFLGEHVAGDLGCSEQRVQAAIDRKILCNTMLIARIVVVPAGLQLFQRDLVWPVAVDLVCAHLNEHGLGRVTATRFEQVQRAHRVDIKIVERALCGQVVARLRAA